jgi:CRP/FNR family transcriptional regulator, nitrogen fixation regulation protein
MLTQITLSQLSGFQPALGRSEAPARLRTSTNKAFAGIPITFSRNAEIYGEEESANYIYKVVSGVVRSCKLLPDGRRQIGAFYMPGDIFGLEPDEVRHFSAEAVIQTELIALEWESLITVDEHSGAFLSELLQITMKGLRRTQAQLLLIGRKNARERVAAFLLDMAGRSGHKGIVELPMPRHDIADYLGLTLETVSRMLAQLRAIGAIELESARRVRLLDLAQLTELAR